MTFFLKSAAFLFAAVLPQAATPTPSNAAAPAAQPGTYHSEALHFDYTYDSSLMRMDSIAKDAMETAKGESQGVAKQTMNCVTLPLMAADSAKGLRVLVMMHLDVKCLGLPVTISKDQLGTLTKGAMVESLTRMGGTPTVGSATGYDLAGHTASAISGQVTLEKLGTTFYGTTSCAVSTTDAVCWEFVSNDCSQLAAMAASPIKFEGKEPVPVVPANLVNACSATGK